MLREPRSAKELRDEVAAGEQHTAELHARIAAQQAATVHHKGLEE
jgi:hypothetical protein